MPELERLAAHHAPAVLRFERENRAYFARYVPDRGDDFFTGYAARHAALLDEQERGTCHFHVLVGDHGAVLGRFNLVDVANGSAELGYRVAERAAGRGLAQEGVRRVCELARTEYGLRRLVASAALANPASWPCSGVPASCSTARCPAARWIWTGSPACGTCSTSARPTRPRPRRRALRPARTSAGACRGRG
ncbi:GNAT family N-acetyltransferase [Micromonospora marina]|uniref:GNAT family N-acetyltransferase n=1 Tax=Micromonospora marina TaxID=307120 RepID=UPI003D747F1B